MCFDQSEFEVKCEWGEQGIKNLAPSTDVFIIIDVLSFTTTVDIGVSRGAHVFPSSLTGEAAAQFALSKGAQLASKRGGPGASLSPMSMLSISKGDRIVLPSPNGSTLSVATGGVPTLAACLRNYEAVSSAAMTLGRRISVIPAGERWEDGSLRPCFEDLLGAGAVLSCLRGSLSPEAMAARAAFLECRPRLPELMRDCGSGKELIQRGFLEDVELASELNVSGSVPTLIELCFRDRGD